MRFHTFLLPATLACILFSGAAHAGPCDAHFTFDGNLSDASGNGYDGILIAKGGGVATNAPSFGEGKNGQALVLSGDSAVRAPLDLSKDACPQVTISAWVKFDDHPTKGTQDIFSSGRNGPRFDRVGTHLEVRSGDQRQLVSNGLRGGRWEFVATAIDQDAGKMTVYWRQRTYERDMKPVGTKAADIWIGASGDDLLNAVQAAAIDDVRIFGQVLTADQVKQIQVGTPRQPGASRIPGDQFDPNRIPGDQFEPAQIPGDQFEPNQIPGDQFEPAQIPGDQFEPNQIPGDQFEPNQIPGDQFEPTQIQGDQAAVINHEEQYSVPDIGDGPATADSEQRVMAGQADSLPGSGNLDGSSDTPTSLMPGGSRGTDLSGNDSLREAVDENTPPDITYGSVEEAEAAAAAAEARRQQELAEAEAAVETTTRTQALEGSGTYPVGEPRESSLAGFEGDIRRHIDLVDHFMHKITWKQVGMSDRPCRILVGGEQESWDMVDFACWTSTSMTITMPPPGSYERQDREVVLPGENVAIGRLEFCRAALNQRLKGVRIWGEQINADGTTTYRDETDSEQFPNCADWSPSVLCPGDTLATGLVVHANDLGGDHRAEIVGLRLICRSIGVR